MDSQNAVSRGKAIPDARPEYNGFSTLRYSVSQNSNSCRWWRDKLAGQSSYLTKHIFAPDLEQVPTGNSGDRQLSISIKMELRLLKMNEDIESRSLVYVV
jgi:hypothetical protein